MKDRNQMQEMNGLEWGYERNTFWSLRSNLQILGQCRETTLALCGGK
jgi:hypothetical protein